METDPPKIEAQWGKTRLVLQSSILAILVFLGGYVMLYADRHNDERYVTKAEYLHDRQTDEQFRIQVQTGLNWRMDNQDKKLDEISADIKSLLRRSP